MNQYLAQALVENPNNGYLRYHARRYDLLLKLIQRYYTGSQTILDVGRSPFTEIACKTFKTQIDTLGFESDGTTECGFNYQFDLNCAQNPTQWRRELPHYDMIIFAEVLEHLYTSPKLVLSFLHSILHENGIMLMQTPNAVVAHKRIQMLLGRNPYSLIAENTQNPAHFREYTAAEIAYYAEQTGFKLEQLYFENYFDYRYSHHTQGHSSPKRAYGLINLLYSFLPNTLRPGLCVVLKAQSSQPTRAIQVQE